MEYEYRVVRSKRKTISIIVERDRSIVVRAPECATDERIRELVQSKNLWLYEKTNHRAKYPAQPAQKEFVAGESLMYLGRNYRLELTDDDVPGVRFQSRFMIPKCLAPDAARLLRDWYSERARIKIIPRAERYANSLGVDYGRLAVSEMKYRWASCSPRGNLNFSWRLIKAPMFVVDYVIVHELAHLLEPNHTDSFWTIVSVQLPRYKDAQVWLRENGHRLEEDL